MSRIPGLGNTKSVIYKKIKQTASDDESSEENTVLDKDDKNAVLLQIIPSTAAKQRRSKEEFDEKRRGNTCRPWLLILVFVVALSILTVGILFARQLQSKDNKKNPPNNKFVPSGDPLDADKMNLEVQDTRKWNRIWKDMLSESCIRLLDMDGDGRDDILFGAENGMDGCHQIGEELTPCIGYLIAVRGYDGHPLWNLTIKTQVFLINCEGFDINKDGEPDCIGAGRLGTAVAFNPYTGNLYWSLKDKKFVNDSWNIYQAVALPDWDGDGVAEVLLANGGDPLIHAENHNRQSGRLFVVSGSTGQPIGETYLEMPNSRETYMTPVLYHPPKGSSVILFGSGGETISGDLMGISVTDLCHYVYGNSQVIGTCPEREAEMLWSHLERNEHGMFTILRGVKKGAMVPPVIIDMNGDSIGDILVSMYEGSIVLKNGKDLMNMWTASFPNMESYSTPAPGYFDDDDILDFMVHWNVGVWPWYSSSNVSVINGKDGSILWTLESSFYQMTSDLVLQTREPHRDVFLFKQKGLGSPYRMNEVGEVVRLNDKKRKKHHGNDERKSDGDMTDAYRNYHLTCDDNLTRHRGEIFLVDRTTVQNPLKILDIPIYKFWYDAPVIDHRKDINSYIKHQSDTDHEHDGVSLSSDADKSHDMNGEMAGEESRSINGKGTIKTKKRCVLLDSDDRTTGALGDLDGDGILEYISIYTQSGGLRTATNSYYMLKYNLHVDVVSLNLTRDDFKPMSVSSYSQMGSQLDLPDLRNLQMLPMSKQKWTQYMGKYGDSSYEN